ncbi:MAG: ABC transporter permease [Candidatus Omnitrophica bacterium]|nr:ABC transporter permease [Candidatus Omnitrophota bacterium]
MNFENWISYRYMTASKGRFLAFLNFISIAGVGVGVMALIVVTGVMTGFGNNLREKIIGATPHIVVEKETGITDFAAVQNQLASMSGVVSTSPFVQGNVFLENEGHAVSQIVRGVDPKTEKGVTKISSYLTEGKLSDLNDGGIIIGQELARYFGYSIGDEVILIAPGSGISGRGWRYTAKVVGIFKSGMVDYDMNLSFITLPQAQKIFDFSANRVSGIGVKLADPYKAKEIKKAIFSELGYSYRVKTWIDINSNLFEALFLEKWGLFIILTLMVLVASFNIISTLIVTVTSKIHDIGILLSFGVPRASIRRIFMKQGLFIGGLGTFWGLVSGVAISLILKTYVKVPAEIYSIDHVPVELQLQDILIIISAAMIITYLATLYPAARAAQLQPVDALRYK